MLYQYPFILLFPDYVFLYSLLLGNPMLKLWEIIVPFLAMERCIGRQKNCILSLGLYILRLRIYKLKLSFYILNLSIENLMRKRWVFVAEGHKKRCKTMQRF